jgi:hypothetical protein
MTPRVRAATGLVAAALLVAVFAGCGGGGDESTDQSDTPLTAKTRAEAAANCVRLRGEVKALGTGAFSAGGMSLTEAATRRVVRPSIPILERIARDQQQLAKGSGNHQFELYARLFEPMIALANERLRSGEQEIREQNANASVVSRGYEILMTSVAGEQRQLAQEAGLASCAIEFEHVLTSALTG